MSETEKNVLLRAEDVAIGYKLGDFKDIGLKEYVTRRLTHNYHVEQFMAVDGVSFTLKKGELLGIVGTNGAGKSTLLKAVAGIMEPRRGTIERSGSVAALLELGSGFDGELTVRENAYLRGAMLGYSRRFMNDTYGDIIAFAELEDYQDRPFKQLSTGMQSRLAFSIASLVQPEILILDEVLSVGDGAFQQKSARKMREIIDRGAATVLVSHSLGQIRELATKVLWLHHGRQVALGDTAVVCDRYSDFLRGDERALTDAWVRREPETELLQRMAGPGGYRVHEYLCVPPTASFVGPYVSAAPGRYRFTVELEAPEEFDGLYAKLTADLGTRILTETTLHRGTNTLTAELTGPCENLEMIVFNALPFPIYLTSFRSDPGLHGSA